METLIPLKCNEFVNTLTMKTRIISVKDWRQNLTKLWKEAEGKDLRYIVMNHSKPMYEVKPLFQEALEIDDNWKREDYYAIANKSFSFWEGDEDDNLFDESVSL